ncbi:hypothetical protein Tco_0845335 [Tanacetum coccineum]
MLDWILGPKSVERASVLHQSDGVGLQRHHIVPIGEFNGVSIALVDRFGVISKSTDMIIVFHGGTATPSPDTGLRDSEHDEDSKSNASVFLAFEDSG